ncbi:MAG: hypothetical protein HYX89_01045, partial [Chloroflexi bacterium]|nr:hypothetical protein [Chloroflexota bacterium]
MMRLGLLGLLGLAIALVLHEQSFPIASIDFRLLGPDAAVAGQTYLERLGVDLSDYQRAVSFDTDSAAQAYLERTLGVQT